MAVKVYWKSLRLLLELLRSYIQRNQLRLRANLTNEQYNCVVAVLDAVLTCLDALPDNTPQ